MIDEDALNIFTDGSSFSGPRTGGVGMCFVTVNEHGNDEVDEFSPPGFKGATNNEMELQACIIALAEAVRHPRLVKVRRVLLFSDSKFVVEGFDRARFTWAGNGWKTVRGTPVDHVDLWKKLLKNARRLQPLPVSFKWKKGHSKKNPHNKTADRLAKASAKNALNAPLGVVKVRRKITDKSVEVGSVGMHGQQIEIRVITSRYLRSHRVHKLKYEVLSEDSPYRGNVDIIYSSLPMDAGHHYEVRVNDNTNNPAVVEMVREVERAQ